MQYNVQAKELKPGQGIIFGILFTLIGIGLLFYSFTTIKNYNEKNKTYKEATSVVVDYDRNDEGLEAIIVEYTVNGQKYRKTSNTYSNVAKSIGTEVKIKYNPNNPGDAIWENDSTNIVMPIAGGIFTIIGIIVAISSAKKLKGGKNNPEIQSENNITNTTQNEVTTEQPIVQQSQNETIDFQYQQSEPVMQNQNITQPIQPTPVMQNQNMTQPVQPTPVMQNQNMTQPVQPTPVMQNPNMTQPVQQPMQPNQINTNITSNQ